jgi:phosphotriesterase-related protein
MMEVNSVNGPIDSKNLGRTLIHEHLVSVDLTMVNAFNDWFDVEDMYHQFCVRAERLKKHGVKTVVDQLPINLGRNIHWLREASLRSGIQILCATGLYHMEEPFISRNVDPEFMAEFFVRDLTEGIQGTPYKAALIKCATDKQHGESEVNKVMLHAAAIASVQTGAPIGTHSNSKLHQGLYQQRIFLENGVEPQKILIGHSFDCLEQNYLTALLENGTYVGCDQIGIVHRASTEALAECVAELIHLEKGYEKQIVLSHDSAIVNDYAYSFARWRRDLAKNTGIGNYDEVFDVMIPELKKRGITQEMIDVMMIDNPRRYFEGKAI